jgi:hypothetical protein
MTIIEQIHSKILMLGFKQICASIFQQLCPGYSNQPHAVIEHIHQTAPGPKGLLVTSTTIKYYQRMFSAARPFATQSTYAVSVCAKFIQGLDPGIIGPFCCFYPQHSMVHNLNGSAYQQSQLVLILATAQAAKDEVKQMQDIARGMMGQSFYTTVISGGDVPHLPQSSQENPDQVSKQRPWQ